MRILKGNPVSPGLAVGPVFQYRAYVCDVFETYVQPGEEQDALAKYNNALGTANTELCAIIDAFSEHNTDKAKIFSAHREILFDEEMNGEIRSAILDERQAPDFAVNRIYTEYAVLLNKADDLLIAGRAADLRDVRNRLIRILHGEQERNLSHLPEPSIVAAHDLLPSDTATMDRENVLAIVTEVGGTTSHSAILARAFEIPAILGVPDATEALENGTEVIVDALSGEVLIDPDAETQAAYRVKRKAYEDDKRNARQFLAVEACTKDGTHVKIGLNIGADIDQNVLKACDFIGLFRTEFLYMEKESLPTEEEQFVVYKRILENAHGKPVTLRTLDIGGDKTLPALQLPKEENPFLGCRALRLCLSHRKLFLIQLRAALRASVYGPLQIMFPMVGSLDDLRAGKAALAEASEQLRLQGVPFDENIKVGIMIEIPSIAIMSDIAVSECSFASVGTNDLCQYLHAADRMNAQTADYYQSYSPAMFRILKIVFDVFNAAGKDVSVCGELAGNLLVTPVLVGLGLRKFSMNPSCIAAVKRELSRFTLAEAKALAERVCQLDTEHAVLELLKNKA